MARMRAAAAFMAQSGKRQAAWRMASKTNESGVNQRSGSAGAVAAHGGAAWRAVKSKIGRRRQNINNAGANVAPATKAAAAGEMIISIGATTARVAFGA